VDDAVVALEEAIADLGTLLVEMDKFRARATSDATALRAACLAIGDRARHAHRHGTLDDALARPLAAEAADARARLVGWLAAIRASAAYARAVDALAGGDSTALRSALPALFDGVAVVAPPAVLFHPVPWQRRGRPRPAGEIADELERWRAEGLPGERDPGAPGVDPALPGVVLQPAPPVGAPVYVAVSGNARPPWVLELAGSGDLVVPGERWRTAFAVALALPEDDLDAWVLDPLAFRSELEAALAARGLPRAEE
jgi:hypothetical protein